VIDIAKKNKESGLQFFGFESDRTVNASRSSVFQNQTKVSILGSLKFRVHRVTSYVGIGNFIMLAYLTMRDSYVNPVIFSVLAFLGLVSILVVDSKGNVASGELAKGWDVNPRNREMIEILRRLDKA